MSKEEVAQLHCKLVATNFEHLPEPAQYARDEGCLSPELAWVHMEETQPGSAATGGGRVGIDDTSLIERGESSSFVAAGDRLLVHFSSSRITACLGDARGTPHSSHVPVEKPAQVERDTTSQERSWKTCVSKLEWISGTSGFDE